MDYTSGPFRSGMGEMSPCVKMGNAGPLEYNNLVMDERPSFRPYLVSTIVLLVFGLGLWALALLAFPPYVWARWLFFFGWTLALSGLSLPVVWFLNLRFPSTPPAGAAVVVRQATWVGVYGATLFWLQQARLVSFWMAGGLALGIAALEYLVRMRERSRWAPRLDPTAAAPKDPQHDA